MKTENKILKIESIKVDDKFYPRENWNWITKAKYYKAMKSGSVFPKICVAKKGFSYILIDGLHRLLAYKDLKETHIECEVLIGLSDSEMFEEAVKRNATHGKQFSTYEIVKIVARLEDFGYDSAKISQLVMIPATELKEFCAKRTTLITETNSNSALKSPLKHLAGVEQEEAIEQSVFHSSSQVKILDSIVSLLENNYIDTNSDMVKSRLHKIYKLLIPYFEKEIEAN